MGIPWQGVKTASSGLPDNRENLLWYTNSAGLIMDYDSGLIISNTDTWFNVDLSFFLSLSIDGFIQC